MRFVSAKSFQHCHTPNLSQSLVLNVGVQYNNKFIFILVRVFSLISQGKAKFYAVMLKDDCSGVWGPWLCFLPYQSLSIGQFHPNLRESQNQSMAKHNYSS